MGIVIKTDILELTPVYNEMVTVVEQDVPALLNEDEYKFVFEIYLEGIVTPIRFDVFPEPTQLYGVLDVHRLLEGYVNSWLTPFDNTNIFNFADGSIIKFHIEYGWSYIDSLGVFTEVLNDVTGTDMYTWDASQTHEEFIDSYNNPNPYFQYKVGTPVTSKREWLTHMETKDVAIDNLGHTQFTTINPTAPNYTEIKTYDSAGALISTFQVANGLSTGLTKSRKLSVATGPKSLNDYPGAFVLGAQPVITSSVDSYTVAVFDSLNNQLTRDLTFNIKEPCRYGEVRVHFYNKLGGFDAYNFQLANKTTSDIQRKKFKQNKYRIDSSGITYNHADRSNLTYYISSQDKLMVNSEFLTDEEHEWLSELVKSPEIYIEFVDFNSNTNYKPVQEVSAKSYTERTGNIDKIFKLELELILSNQDYRQRR